LNIQKHTTVADADRYAGDWRPRLAGSTVGDGRAPLAAMMKLYEGSPDPPGGRNETP